MWIPDWLYKRLPLIYGVAGAACLWFFDSTLHGLPSALLFFAAALRTYTLRRLERSDGPLDSKRRPPGVQGNKRGAPRYARN